MIRITRNDSPYTLLQQRLQYIAQHPERSFTYFLENVPQWEATLHPVQLEDTYIREYAPCNGYDFLIEALKERDRAKYKVDFRTNHFLITNGAMHALSLLFRSLYRPGAVALVQAPVLGSIVDILKASGYKIVFFYSDQQGEMDIEQLYKLYTPDMQFVYVNTPHNPMGEIISQHVMAQLVRFVQEKGISLVADMLYDSFTFDGKVTHSPLLMTSDWSQVYTVNSMSKNYGSPGLRIGWITSSTGNIEKLSGLCEAECVSISGISQFRAYKFVQQGNRELVEAVRSRKELIENQLGQMKQLEYNRPSGGTQFLVKFPVEDIDLFADFMLLEYGVALTTTSNYAGLDGSYIRIPLVYPVETTKRALQLLEKGLVEYPLRLLCTQNDDCCNLVQ
ncbi:beta-methylarginine biosynthesis bifunctional aminotransferase [Paenibacillus sp. SC116]|uniref:beta-methylarginine biosynthesis bifunctional aminotransferase n=1 Tax=Paenibacillus sp. SC116 TaxID=2968986 RepID=UPI00215A8C52|nr:beta-methylarginine biosynthesis bifunctional aminotransferase [Paenibacillus sp. SC116]MCR8844954.1 beta-methylarginine biosynthesis bifunctional aminotransferase [Paenibacillus sp. SC116]